MPNSKNIGSIAFYTFIIVFIILAYLNNNGALSSLFTKKNSNTKQNIVEMEFKQKEYKADYPKKFDKGAIELSSFDEGEKWKGTYKIDSSNFWEGKGSYVILSKNHQATVLSLQKNIDLSDYSILKILIYSEKEDNTDNIKKLSIKLGSRDDSAYYEYDILNIKPGWNIVQMSKDNFTLVNGLSAIRKEGEENAPIQNSVNNDRLWERIEKISVELTSRPNSQVELSLDRLWAEKNEDYKKDFLTGSFDMISPKSLNGKTYMNFWSLGASSGLIRKVTAVKNFTYTAKIIPQKKGTFGIAGRLDYDTGYGYYLDMGGIDSGTWSLYKVGKVVDNSSTTQLDNGALANFLIEANQPVWLRLSISGDIVTGYFSTDGTNFTKLTEKNDSELKSGSIGIHVTNASFLLDSVEFKQ